MGVKSFNSADLNNIAKKDGRYNVIENISGAKRTLNPPAAAYSVRKLTGLTGVPYDGPAMRILVDATGDGPDATDLEFDINFTADGDLDVADIELKCTGGKDAYVVKWYDQSGAGNDAAQTTYASMPKICSAGSVILDNGNPALDFNSGQTFAVPSAVWDKDDFSSFLVGNAHNYDDVFLSFSPDSTDWAIYVVQQKDTTTLATRLWLNSAAADVASGTNALNNQVLVSSVSDVSLSDLQSFIDGSQITGTTLANGAIGTMAIGASNVAGSRGLDGTIQELVFFGDAKNSTEKSDIENNINSYFNIYQSRENILPGAAAAYSLRQLSDSSRLAVRVRRDTGVGSGTDDDEADVGFDANGEVSLDSPVSNFDPTGSAATTLGEFLADAAYDDKDSLGAPAEGLVTAWYDQSVNANNATQAAPGSQPKIYDSSTGLIKENGKPALDWDGTNDVLITSYTPTVTHTAFFAQVPVTSTFAPVYASENTSNLRFWAGASGDNTMRIYRGGSASFSEGTTLSGQYLGYVLNKATVTDVRLGVDGSNVAASGNIGSGYITKLRLGADDQSGFYGDSRIQEFIIYDSDNSSNKSSIEGNMNAHYGIANIGTPSSGLLADYPGSTAAYSVRKLADTASLAMRIIVDDTAVIGTVDASDTEYDIGFDVNGDLDVARIREVCNNPSGANYNAYVVTWYDQSGNGNHATQTTYTACPQIYDGVDVTMENGKPALDFDNSNDYLRTAAFSSVVTQPTTWTIVCKLTNDQVGNVVAGGITAANRQIPFAPVDDGGTVKDYMFGGANLWGNAVTTGHKLIFTLFNGVSSTMHNNNTLSASGNAGTNSVAGITIGARYANDEIWDGTIQEMILFDGSQASNRKAIETDIDSYYRIYGDPDDGLLSTPYGKGAAAAYSVRRLSNNATRAMRILVDADANGPDASDNEYDIGFDVNGELDIARIEELCDKGTGNYNAYVTKWYDQSGEGNDAAQTTYASMPKICNAGTVILENGKPALDFDGVDDFFTTVSFNVSDGNIAAAFVLRADSFGTYCMSSSSTVRGAYSLNDHFFIHLGTTPNTTRTSVSQPSGQALISWRVNDGTTDLYENGSSVKSETYTGSMNTAVESLDLMQRNNNSSRINGTMQEVVLYGINKGSDIEDINSNINDYFNIEGV